MTKQLKKLIEEVEYTQKMVANVNLGSLSTTDMLNFQNRWDTVQGLLEYLKATQSSSGGEQE